MAEIGERLAEPGDQAVEGPAGGQAVGLEEGARPRAPYPLDPPGDRFVPEGDLPPRVGPGQVERRAGAGAVAGNRPLAPDLLPAPAPPLDGDRERGAADHDGPPALAEDQAVQPDLELEPAVGTIGHPPPEGGCVAIGRHQLTA